MKSQLDICRASVDASSKAVTELKIVASRMRCLEVLSAGSADDYRCYCVELRQSPGVVCSINVCGL